MTTTVSDGTTTLTPLLVDGYSAAREARNLLHAIIDTEWHSVTLRPAHPRSGTLRLACETLADALAMDELHAQPAILTLADTTLPGLNMQYVANGSITVELDDDTRKHWWVEVDFQEVQT